VFADDLLGQLAQLDCDIDTVRAQSSAKKAKIQLETIKTKLSNI
jgi:hypothetical protein